MRAVRVSASGRATAAKALPTRRYSTAPAAAASVARSERLDIVPRLKEELSLAGRAEVGLVKNISSGFSIARTKVLCVLLQTLADWLLSRTFPSLVPNSYITATAANERAEAREKHQLEISKHLLHEAEHEMSHAKGDTAVAFQRLLKQGGRSLHPRDFHPLLKFFSDHFGLSHLPHAKLQAIASFFGVHTEGTDSFLRASILGRLAELREDDDLIHEQGIDTLTDNELRDALLARGTPVTGKSRDDHLKALRDWFHISSHSMTPYLLVLTRADPYTDDELHHAAEALEAAHLAEKRATTLLGVNQEF